MAKRLTQGTMWLTAAWLAAVLFLHSQAGTGIGTMFLIAYGGGFIVVIWLALFLLSVQPHSARPSPGVLPLILLGIGAVVFLFAQPPFNPLFRIRFALSRSSLTAAATQELRVPTHHSKSWIGLFPIESAAVTDGEVRFITARCSAIDSCGLLYAPSGSPRPTFDDGFFPLGDGWYHVHQGF